MDFYDWLVNEIAIIVIVSSYTHDSNAARLGGHSIILGDGILLYAPDLPIHLLSWWVLLAFCHHVRPLGVVWV